ncbi:MAG: hypothetical protein AB8I08_21500 [Sandaracinaceae bacterium]
MRRWILALALLFVGCIGVPQPEPPSLDPSGVVSAGARNAVFGFAVLPGSVEPAVGDLWVVGLDDTDDPQLLPVAPDGSVDNFELNSGNVRMQIRDGETRARPVDLVRDAETVRVAEPTLPCLEIPLEVEVGRVQVGRPVELTFDLLNMCAEDVDVVGAMRRPGDITIVDMPSTVAAGSSASARVQLTPSAVGLREEVLLVSHALPVAGRRAVTLFGTGLP